MVGPSVNRAKTIMSKSQRIEAARNRMRAACNAAGERGIVAHTSIAGRAPMSAEMARKSQENHLRDLAYQFGGRKHFIPFSQE